MQDQQEYIVISSVCQQNRKTMLVSQRSTAHTGFVVTIHCSSAAHFMSLLSALKVFGLNAR